MVWPLQAPLLDAMKMSDLTAATTRPHKAEHRTTFRSRYQAYFETLAAAQGGGDGVDTAVRPVLYHSVLGIKEEEMTMTMKSKKSTAPV